LLVNQHILGCDKCKQKLIFEEVVVESESGQIFEVDGEGAQMPVGESAAERLGIFPLFLAEQFHPVDLVSFRCPLAVAHLRPSTLT
jgi:hypothetical protein